MAEPHIALVIYSPPEPGLPYLAVAISSDGDVSVVPYETLAEAQNHVRERAQAAVDTMSEGDNG